MRSKIQHGIGDKTSTQRVTKEPLAGARHETLHALSIAKKKLLRQIELTKQNSREDVVPLIVLDKHRRHTSHGGRYRVGSRRVVVDRVVARTTNCGSESSRRTQIDGSGDAERTGRTRLKKLIPLSPPPDGNALFPACMRMRFFFNYE